MRKRIQKGRCTKLMLDKCKSVCCLYDKVQIAAAKMLNADPFVYLFECNVPLDGATVNDVNLPSELYSSDFLIYYDDGTKPSVKPSIAPTCPVPQLLNAWTYPGVIGHNMGLRTGALSSKRRTPSMKTNDLRLAENAHTSVFCCKRIWKVMWLIVSISVCRM